MDLTSNSIKVMRTNMFNLPLRILPRDFIPLVLGGSMGANGLGIFSIWGWTPQLQFNAFCYQHRVVSLLLQAPTTIILMFTWLLRRIRNVL
ncbi:hypothetical protein K438DRAFT_772335 [Mycena galopus ATCC 62051]|nr:hypothetical protein K438DRAFT_772335 [Mycena galopus ATCC 62051]